MMSGMKIYVCFFPYVLRNYAVFTNTVRCTRTKKKKKKGCINSNQIPCSKEFNAFFVAKDNISMGFKLRKPVKYL